jgi:GDP-L-fucose synthase
VKVIIRNAIFVFINIGIGIDVIILEMAETMKRAIDFEGELKFDSSKSDGSVR